MNRRLRLTTIGAALALAALFGSGMVAPTPAEATPKPVQSLKVDVDGDGHADAIRVYRLGTYKFRITVATRKKTVKKDLATVKDDREPRPFGKPLYGAAKLDGVAGQELIVATTDIGATGFVLTWRKGGLVREKGPRNTAGGRAWCWDVGAGDTAVGYRLSTAGGKRYIDAVQLGFDSQEPNLMYRRTRSVRCGSRVPGTTCARRPSGARSKTGPRSPVFAE